MNFWACDEINRHSIRQTIHFTMDLWIEWGIFVDVIYSWQYSFSFHYMHVRVCVRGPRSAMHTYYSICEWKIVLWSYLMDNSKQNAKLCGHVERVSEAVQLQKYEWTYTSYIIHVYDVKACECRMCLCMFNFRFMQFSMAWVNKWSDQYTHKPMRQNTFTPIYNK